MGKMSNTNGNRVFMTEITGSIISPRRFEGEGMFKNHIKKHNVININI